MGDGRHLRACLIVRYENELKDKDQANDGGLGAMETKTGVDIFLFHEEAKQNQRDQQIDLTSGTCEHQTHSHNVMNPNCCMYTYLSECKQFEGVAEGPVAQFVGQDCQHLLLVTPLHNLATPHHRERQRLGTETCQ